MNIPAKTAGFLRPSECHLLWRLSAKDCHRLAAGDVLDQFKYAVAAFLPVQQLCATEPQELMAGKY
ncbi:hypothetical protein CDR68_00285 [Salmonella enterica]|nr:hypothetical protein [Salmonella enterica]